MRSRRSILSPFLSTLMIAGAFSTSAQDGIFSIWKDDERVGSLLIDRSHQGDRTHYAMTSVSNVSVVFWSYEIRTSVTAEYAGEQLEACRSSVRVNDELRDSSDMRLREGVARGYVHPDGITHGGSGNTWTTARMYYEEPVGQPSIYVESLLHDCPLERTGDGAYRLVLPDDKVNRYVYRDGILREVHVDRSLFDLVFRRA